MYLRSKKRLSLLSVSLAVVGLALAGVAPSAMAKACAKPGMRVSQKESSMVFLTQKVNREGWDGGMFQTYACSYKYGKRWLLMNQGRRNGHERHIRFKLGNQRYAAYVAHTRLSESIALVDLKNGADLFSSSPLSVSYAQNYYVTQMILGSNGNLGWITKYFSTVVGPPFVRYEVHLRDSTGNHLLASGPDIDPVHLTFGRNDATLAWRLIP